MERLNRSIGTTIKSDVRRLAAEAYALQREQMPELKALNSNDFIEKSIRDTEYSILYLSNAITVSSTKLFENYMEWFVGIMESISLPVKYLRGSIESIFEVAKNHYDETYIDIIENFVRRGIYVLDHHEGVTVAPKSTHTLIPFRDRYIHHLLEGDRFKANALVQELVSNDVLLEDIYMEIFHESQREIGRLWQTNQITIAEEHYCTAATQLIMGQLYPKIFSTPKNDLVFVGTCVSGELHELGMRMVSDLMEFSGWNTYYLGANIPIKSIVETVVKERANVIGISVTMTYHLEEASQLIEKIKSNEQCSNLKIIVGGYPFIVEEELWKAIGADGYAQNARDAVIVANKLANKFVAGVAHDKIRG